MTSFRQRNDERGGRGKRFGKGPAGGQGGGREGGGRREAAEGSAWLWGWHAVVAALKAQRREARRLVASPERAKALPAALGRDVRAEIFEAAAIGQMLPQGAVHQGIALKVGPMPALTVADLASPAEGVILMLDQVTDPQNVGAIFRSAAAFGARGVVLQDRHAPLLVGALAKAAAGAVDALPCAVVVNLSRALETLSDLGWRAVGLEAGGELNLAEAFDGTPTVIVMGSEGEGLRRLVAEHCDVLAKIPMPGGFESLNVSAAAAVALYEASRAKAP